MLTARFPAVTGWGGGGSVRGWCCGWVMAGRGPCLAEGGGLVKSHKKMIPKDVMFLPATSLAGGNDKNPLFIAAIVHQF